MPGGAYDHRHDPSMMGAHETVNGYWNPKHDDAQRVIECQRNLGRKKTGLQRARLEVLANRGRHNHLPRGITEPLLRWRRGTKRGATPQHTRIMVRGDAMQQASEPHVSHAEN